MTKIKRRKNHEWIKPKCNQEILEDHFVSDGAYARAGAELWNQLPLDDAAIAELLDLTRQHVVNLRKSARKRLTRRLKGFF